MSTNGQEDPNYQERLNTLLAAAKQKTDQLSSAAEATFNNAVGQAQELAQSAKSTYDSAMQKVQQGMGELQQQAQDAKASFDKGMQQSVDALNAAKEQFQQGLSSAAQQGQQLAAKAADTAKQGVDAAKDYVKEMTPEFSKEAAKQMAGHAAETIVTTVTRNPEWGETAKQVTERGIEWLDAGGAELAKHKLDVAKTEIKDATTVSSPEQLDKMAQQDEKVSKDRPANQMIQDSEFRKAHQQDLPEGKPSGAAGGEDAATKPAPDKGDKVEKLAEQHEKVSKESPQNKVLQDPDLNKRTPEAPKQSSSLSPELAAKYAQRQADLKQPGDGTQTPSEPKGPAAAPTEVPVPTATPATPTTAVPTAPPPKMAGP